MGKICKINQGHFERNVGWMYNLKDKENKYSAPMTITGIEKEFGREIMEAIGLFYSNQENRCEDYNIVLLTDEELNKLEKKSKQ